MNAQAKLAFNIIDHAWTEKRLAAFEDEALMSFDTVPTRAKTADTPDGRGLTILPVAPADHAPSAPRLDPDRHRRPADRAEDNTPTAGTTGGDNDRTSDGSSDGDVNNGRFDGWDIPD